MKIITRYECAVCGTEWSTKAMAEACEAFQLPPCPVHDGQKVKVYERYDGPEDDEIVSIRVGPSFYIGYGSPQSWEQDHGEDGYRLMSERHPNITFHEWYVKVKNRHLMNKDGDTANEVALDHIMVDGAWLRR